MHSIGLLVALAMDSTLPGTVDPISKFEPLAGVLLTNRQVSC